MRLPSDTSFLCGMLLVVSVSLGVVGMRMLLSDQERADDAQARWSSASTAAVAKDDPSGAANVSILAVLNKNGTYRSAAEEYERVFGGLELIVCAASLATPALVYFCADTIGRAVARRQARRRRENARIGDESALRLTHEHEVAVI